MILFRTLIFRSPLCLWHGSVRNPIRVNVSIFFQVPGPLKSNGYIYILTDQASNVNDYMVFILLCAKGYVRVKHGLPGLTKRPLFRIMIQDMDNIDRKGELAMGYELKSARYLARDVLSRAVCPGDAVVDATMGNGHDTAFLCEAVGPSGHVYAFDVQAQAVSSTESLLRREGLLDRAELFCCGHQRMDEYVRVPVRAVVFNLGWLPGGDHTVTTFWETIREAVSKALDLLLPGGVLVLCAYPGHPEGDRERHELAGFFSALSIKTYNVLHQRFLNAGPGAPECFVVQKLL